MNTQPIHAVPRFLLAFVLAFSLSLPTAGLAYATPDEESTPPAANEAQQPDSTASDDTDSGAGEGNGVHSHDLETDQAASPCIPSEEDIAKWEADGTLDERIAFQESLGNGEVSSSLIAQAIQRATGPTKLRSLPKNNLPGGYDSEADKAKRSMPTTGNAKVIALRVDFPSKTLEYEDGSTTTIPAMGFDEYDTLDALQNLIGTPPIFGEASVDDSNDAFKPYDSLNDYYYRSSYGKLNITGDAFNYTAKYPRSEYEGNVDALFAEALEWLDDRYDLSQYDVDGEGYIDAVYLHFAGGDSGWGSTWWSNCNYYQSTQPELVDGKIKIGRIVTLHNPSNTAEGIQTAIHETGHVLGLPDYYSYESYRVKSDPSYRTGILTFDMMNKNMGDHNAYSKWLLGWIEDSKITRVVANDEGITVKKDGSVQMLSTDEASYEATVDLLASHTPTDCGGFIAVSNSERLLDPLGLFSSFYLLEYNGHEGNQVINCYAGDDGYNAVATKIPYGFRLFRIQAEVDPETGNFIRENKVDDVHNQFIELVDHDAAAWHNEYIGMADGTGMAPYGCMMTTGDAISPEGATDSSGSFAEYPSTNFFENIYTGFTGLSIQITHNDKESGTALISYSDTLKPDINSDMLTLSQVSPRGIDSTDIITLQGSMPLARAGFTETPYLLVNDARHDVYVEDPSGTTIAFNYSIPAEDFPANTPCEVVFPAGFFSLGRVDGNEILSDEIRIPLTTNDVLIADTAGVYEKATSDRAVMSNPITAADGSTYFATSNLGKIELHKVNAADPTQTSCEVIPGIGKPNANQLHLEALANGELCLITNTYAGNLGYENVAYWIDPTTSSVSKTSYLPYLNPGTSFSTISTVGSGLVVTWSEAWNYELPSSIRMEAHIPTEDGYVSIHSWTIDAVGATHEVRNVDGRLAFTGNSYPDTASTTKIIDVKQFIIDNMRTDYLGFDGLDAETIIDSSAYGGISAFAYYDGKYLACAYDLPAGVGSPDLDNQATQPAETVEAPAWRDSTDVKGYLVSFDEDGNETSSYLFGTYPSGHVSFDAISISPEGVPALEISLDPNSFPYRRVLFFKNGIESKPITYTSETVASGTWLHNDAWLDTYFFYTGGYEDMHASVHYLLAFLPDSPEDGDDGDGDGNGDGDTGTDPKPDPIPGTPSDGANGSGDKGGKDSSALSKAGDPLKQIMIICTVASMAAITLAEVAFRALRRQKRR